MHVHIHTNKKREIFSSQHSFFLKQTISFLFNDYRKAGPYPYEGNKDTFDRWIVFLDRVLRCALKLSKEKRLGENVAYVMEAILKLQEVLFAMKLIRRDIAFIKDDDIKDLHTPLGSGYFGTVKLCETHGVKCAVKEFNMANNPSFINISNAINSYYIESYAARKAISPNVVKVLGFSIDPFRVVTEFAECGNLGSFLAKNYPTLSRTEKFSIALGVLNGLDWVTNVANILHQDIKPDNILIDKFHTPKISDFGLIRILCDEHDAYIPQGNCLHQAPESLKRKDPYCDKSSIMYAFGLILYAIMAGKTPYEDIIEDPREWERFPHLDSRAKLVKMVCEERRPPTLSWVPEEVQKIVLECISPEPCERPTFEDVSDKLWDAYITREIPQEAPRCFWDAHFSKLFGVQFDVFSKNFLGTPSEKVKDVFCGENCRVITPRRFGELYALFGPWYDASNRHILAEVAEIISEDWFMTGPKDMVDGVIEGAGAKTFGVRLSSAAAECPFCVVYKSVGGDTQKRLVKRKSMDPTWYECGGIRAVSVQDIVTEFRRRGLIENHYVPEKRDYNESLIN